MLGHRKQKQLFRPVNMIETATFTLAFILFGVGLNILLTCAARITKSRAIVPTNSSNDFPLCYFGMKYHVSIPLKLPIVSAIDFSRHAGRVVSMHAK